MANHAGMKIPRGGERRGVTGVGGGSLCHGLEGRSVVERVNAGDLALGGHSQACGSRGSR